MLKLTSRKEYSCNQKMKNNKSEVEKKKPKLNKTKNINKNKCKKKKTTTKLLNEKTYLFFLRCTSCSEL
jgi:hypothetical protein